MSKKAKKEKAAPAETEAAVEAAPQEPQEPQESQPPQVPKEREPLRLILTILLVLVGIGEAALCAYIGFSVFRGIQAQRQYEQAGDQTGTAQAVGLASYAGPWTTIENGVVIRQREDGLSLGAAGTSGATDGASGEKRMSSLSAVMIHYRLADMDGTADENQPEPPEADADEPVIPEAA